MEVEEGNKGCVGPSPLQTTVPPPMQTYAQMLQRTAQPSSEQTIESPELVNPSISSNPAAGPQSTPDGAGLRRSSRVSMPPKKLVMDMTKAKKYVEV